MLKGLLLIEAASRDMVYGPDEMAAIRSHVGFIHPPQTRESVLADPSVLNDVEVIFSGWGMPRFDDRLLRHAPSLEAIFYAAGSVDGWATDAVWERGIAVTSAVEANSIPVAEYTLATTLFSLKHGWTLAQQTRRDRTFPNRNDVAGAFESTVGIVSLGTIGRRVASLLRAFDVRVIGYDPHVTPSDARALGVELVGLEELFRQADVVTVHTPETTQTRGMIRGHHLASMKQGATFINSSRGAIVREEEMLDVLELRLDLRAVLDVVCVEPPPAHSRLYTLQNVVLTPHIAGSAGAECRRMARYMVKELERYVRGEPLLWAVPRTALMKERMVAVESAEAMTPDDLHQHSLDVSVASPSTLSRVQRAAVAQSVVSAPVPTTVQATV